MHGVSNRRFAPLALLAVATAMLMGACGSDGRKASTGGDAAPPAERAETPGRPLAGPQCGPGQRTVVAAPTEGILHGAMPSLLHDDALSGPRSGARVRSFERLADRKLAWVYFSDNWFQGIRFPAEAVESVRETGALPFIRLMPRSDWKDGQVDPKYPLSRIAKGDFDADLRTWATSARDSRVPLLVDFAPEMNGNWFPWSGAFNGGAENGPETYKAAYRHVVDLFREQGADNVGFAFHVNVRSAPDEPWNDMARYYPGDDYIDWIGLSAYGGVFPGYDWEPLRRALDEAYPKLAALSPTKPIAILETGVLEERGKDKAAWIRSAYDALRMDRYPRLKAAIWWHERWTNADERVSDVRIDSDAAATAAYRRAVAGPQFVARPEYACAPKA
jgi:hypothetical protein